MLMDACLQSKKKMDDEYSHHSDNVDKESTMKLPEDQTEADDSGASFIFSTQDIKDDKYTKSMPKTSERGFSDEDKTNKDIQSSEKERKPSVASPKEFSEKESKISKPIHPTTIAIFSTSEEKKDEIEISSLVKKM